VASDQSNIQDTGPGLFCKIKQVLHCSRLIESFSQPILRYKIIEKASKQLNVLRKLKFKLDLDYLEKKYI
jgi:hypothetical protein